MPGVPIKMTKLTATFDGLQITIEGAEGVTAHQLCVASEKLKAHGLSARLISMDSPTVIIDFDNFHCIISITPDIKQERLVALAAELAMVAQFSFDAPRLQGLVQAAVQMTLQAMAQNAEKQRLMAGMKKTPGGVLTPH